MTPVSKAALKQALGELPLTAEMYWALRQGRRAPKGFSLDRLQAALPEWQRQAAASTWKAAAPRKVMVFCTLRYWIEQAALMGAALAGLGHEVTLAYLPYRQWQQEVNRFDLRRQQAYLRSALKGSAPLMQPLSLLDVKTDDAELPDELMKTLHEISVRDVQYTEQVEDADLDSDLYHFRLARNTQAARAASTWMKENQPDVVILPNGSILEFGAVYAAARSQGVPVVTYEFGEQRDRIWLARDAEIMHQDTDSLWAARQDRELSPDQLAQVQDLFASRQRADLWENFSRRWQGVAAQGAEKTRAELGLDERPVALLAANVIGDSLTLGRQVYTETMTDWLQRTVRYFAGRPEVQLVVRVHPGERYLTGPSVEAVVQEALPELPDHIHVVAFDAQINTYDLVAFADLGLVYTTTTGMEMAMSGLPVIVSGKTHYARKGFTLDPDTWEEFTQLVDQALGETNGQRMSQEQVERAWHYAYRFFFDCPRPFPWHLLHVWEDLETWPLARLFSEEGQAQFGETFAYLAGEPIDWNMN